MRRDFSLGRMSADWLLRYAEVLKAWQQKDPKCLTKWVYNLTGLDI